MMKRVGWSLLGIVVSACSSETSDTAAESPCADIAGNYSVTTSRVSGTCDSSLDKTTSTLGVTKGADGTYTLIFPGLEGGCAATLDATSCKLTAPCSAKAADGTTVATANLDYTFTKKGYTGSSAFGIRPPSVTTACDVTYRETGTKL